MHHVVEAAYADGYRIRVQFEDGQEKLVDLAPHLGGPLYQPLRDLAYFRRFQVSKDIDTVVWPNGADFSPDFLYEIGTETRQYRAVDSGVSIARGPDPEAK